MENLPFTDELQKRMQLLEEDNQRLREQLYIYKKIYDNLPEPYILLDENKKIVDANPAACTLFETNFETLMNSSITEFLSLTPPEVFEDQRMLIRENGMLEDEWLIRSKNGLVKHIEFFSLGNILPNIDLYILKDVTARKRLEFERFFHLQLFNNIFNQVIDGIVMFDEKGIIVNANPAFCQYLKKDKNELIGFPIQAVLAGDDSSRREESGRILSKAPFIGEIQLKSGEERKVFEISTSPNVYNGLYMSILRDKTEKYEMENELYNIALKFRNVFHGALDGMILWKNGLKIYDMNSAGKKILGLTEQDDIHKQLDWLFCRKGNKKDFFRNVFLELHQKGEKRFTMDIETADGKVRTLEMTSKRDIVDGIHLTVFRDITERMKMEEQLRKTETLNVIGELAAGIAHEIRNPMTSLKGFIQLLQNSISGYAMYFDIITAELNRIESIVNEFLVLGRPQVLRFYKCDITRIMRETIDLLYGQAVLNNVQFRTHFAKNIPKIYCDPNRIKQVFINIIKNAIEVMKEGGFVTIEIKKEMRNTLVVAISDEGGGIGKEDLKRLGEPFYTTKERGTGLGLMVSYNIISEHKGKIMVESDLGKGTTFFIYLPILQKEELEE